MGNALIIIGNSTADETLSTTMPAVVSSLADRARGYAAVARAENTRRGYASDVRAFEAWCAERGLCSFPAPTAAVLGYLVDRAGTLKITTLRRHLAAIRETHAAAGHALDTASPAFRDAWAGIRRTHGRPPAQKRALLTAELRRAVEALPETLAGRRDRALLLVGFAAALRRSELVGLEIARRDSASWIEVRDEGLVIHLSRTKTDQTGAGADVAVPFGSNPDTCPVRAYRAWLKASKLKAGPAFRQVDRHGHLGEVGLTGRAVARILKRVIVALARAEGDTPRQAGERAAAYAGHSLRSGLATSAAANDAPGHAIQRQLRHARFDTTTRYIRSGNLFRQNAAGLAGL